MSGTAKAVLIGGAVAVLAVGVFIAAVVLHWFPRASEAPAMTRVLVIATVPSESGGESAPLAFALDTSSKKVLVLDALRSVVVPGTSAKTASESYPYGGGAAVANALSGQTQGQALPWIVLPPKVWAKIVDDFGGVTADVPSGVSVYTSGTLTLVPEGRSRLSGAQLVGLVSALDYVGNRDKQHVVVSDVSSQLSAIIEARPLMLSELVTSGAAHSSVDAQQLAAFAQSAR